MMQRQRARQGTSRHAMTRVMTSSHDVVGGTESVNAKRRARALARREAMNNAPLDEPVPIWHDEPAKP